MLVGHQNPLGTYPACVIPVVDIDGKQFAVHDEGSGEQRLVSLEANESFVPVDVPSVDMTTFAPHTDRILAESAQTLHLYPRDQEERFFYALLSDPNFTADAPFTRYEFAWLTKDPDIFGREFASCLAWLMTQEHLEGTPRETAFLESWYRQQLNEITLAKEDCPWLRRLVLPGTWVDLLKSNWYATHFLPHPEHTVEPGRRSARVEEPDSDPVPDIFPTLSQTFAPI